MNETKNILYLQDFMNDGTKHIQAQMVEQFPKKTTPCFVSEKLSMGSYCPKNR